MKPIDDIKFIFDNINQWLSFMELKNGALIAFNITFLTFLKDIKNIFYSKDICFCCTIISLIISLSSFYPNIKNFKKGHLFSNHDKSDINLLFYGDIEKLSPSDFLQKIHSNYYNEKNLFTFSQKEIDYAEEIIMNAKIIMRKGILFKYSLVFLLIGICILVICNFLYFLNYITLIYFTQTPTHN